MWQHNINVTAT